MSDVQIIILWRISCTPKLYIADRYRFEQQMVYHVWRKSTWYHDRQLFDFWCRLILQLPHNEMSHLDIRSLICSFIFGQKIISLARRRHFSIPIWLSCTRANISFRNTVDMTILSPFIMTPSISDISSWISTGVC